MNEDINIADVPANTTAAILGIGVGGCVSPGLNLGFCGNITISPTPPLIFGVKVLSGLGTCSGHAEFGLPVGLESKFCGLTISAQWVVACRGKQSVGYGVSNCVAAQLTSN